MNQEDAYPERPEQRTGSMVMVSVNGGLYPMKTVTQCRTCMSPHRMDIERMVLEGYSYKRIAREIEGREQGRWPHPEFSSIQRHVNSNHMPIGPTTERALIERRSKEIGRDLEDYAESLIDHRSANQLIIKRGMERMLRGEVNPSMSDLMAAIRQESALDQSVEGGMSESAWQEALIVYMEVAQRLIPPERHQEYGRALAEHPVLRAIAARAAGTPAIEGEVVHEEVGE